MTTHLSNFKYFLIASVLTVSTATGQGRNEEFSGSVRLKSGMILDGVCSYADTFHPTLLPLRLQMRRIDQQFRTYFVHTSNSDSAVGNELAVPKFNLRIHQRREHAYPMTYEIGLHRLSPFDAEGRRTMTLTLSNGETAEVRLGVTNINFQGMTLKSLSHDWEFGMGLDSIPDSQLYSGKQNPGLLKLATQFSNPEERLNMVALLLRAEKFVAARQLLNDIIADHPKFKPQTDRLVETWNDQVGRLAVTELERLQLTGRKQTARLRSQNWPEDSLSPAIRVSVQQVDQTVTDALERLRLIQQALGAVLGSVEDPAIKRQAIQLHSAVIRQLDLNLLDRMAAFELLQDDESITPESKLALAASALWLGVDNAFDNFPEAYGLLQIRYLLTDYCVTSDDQQAIRDQCIDDIRKQEGFSTDRITALLKTLTPVAPLSLQQGNMQAQPFEWSDETGSTECIGSVPQEYQESHRYPLLLALPRAGGEPSEAVSYWQDLAEKNGFILAVPEVRDADRIYTASAAEHRRFQSILRRIRSGLSIDPDRIFIVGHGMGGSAALDFATACPDTFAAVASVGGLGRKHLNWSIHNFCHIPSYLVAGTKQPRYYTRFGNLLEKMFRPTWKGCPQRYHNTIFARYQERGFEQFTDARGDIFQWLNYQRRGASPEKFETKIVRSSDEASFWAPLVENGRSAFPLDAGSGPNEPLESTLNVAGYRRGNSYRLTSLPGPAHVLIYSDLDDFNQDEPVRITVVRDRPKTLDVRANTKDMLDHFRQHLDPSRICLMKIPVGR